MERWGGGGVSLMHVYKILYCICMGTHTWSQPFLQSRLMDIYETWKGWSAYCPLQVLLFFGQIRPGADTGRGQNRSRGPLLQRTSSLDWKATATNRMHSNDLKACGKKCCYFCFHSEVKFLTRFSSPEPKAQVSYCHSAPSVVRQSVRRRPSSSVVRTSVNFHIFNFFSRTAWWILMKFGRDEVLMVPYKCSCFLARSAEGRIQGGAKKGQRGSPSSRNFFRPEGYSDKPNG